MADAPSPYAPGIIADERPPPRPAGRAAPFLIGTFVATILASGLWQIWVTRGMPTSVRLGGLALIPLLRNLPALPILLWAYLSDRVPVWGTRREGYLALATLTMGAAWVVIAAADGPLAWVAVAAPFSLATSFARAAILGALAEIGGRHAATGRLAAAHVGLSQLAELALQPALVAMTFTSIWLVAGIAAGLALAVALLIVTLSGDDAPPLASPPEPVLAIPRFLRSRAFWGSTAVLFCVGLATVPQALVWPQLRAAHSDPIESWRALWTLPALTGAAALAYLVVCRRLPVRALLRAVLLLKAGTLAAQALSAGSTTARTLEFVANLRAAGDGFAAAAMLDLVLRAAPRGREAFGAILLAGIPTVMTAFVTILVVPLSRGSVSGTALFATGAAIAGALAVSLLPGSITEAREGRVVGSAP